MTQKIFKIEVKGATQLTTYKTRNEALDSIFSVLRNNENYNLQDFRIIETEAFAPKATLIDAAAMINARLSFSGLHQILDYIADGEGFIELSKEGTYPSWNSVELGFVFEVINEFNKTLPEGYEVFFSITHEAHMRVMLQQPEDKTNE